MDTTKKSVLEKIAYVLLVLVVAISPLIFISSQFVPIELSKSVFITLGVLISTVVFIVSAYKRNEISVPKHAITVFSSLIALSIVVSTVLSPNFSKSLFGQGFELGTASFLLVMFLVTCLTINLTHKHKDRFFYIYGAILASFGILAVFHVIRFIFGSDILTLGVLQYSTSTIIGKWGDLGIFSGLVTILTYTTIRFVSLSRLYKNVLYVLMLISVAFVLLVNYKPILVALSIVFVFMLAYEYYHSKIETNSALSLFKSVPWTTTVLTLIFILGFVGSTQILGKIQTKLNIIPVEVVLPWQLTLDITSKTLIESPLFGVGPNRFVNQYLKYKPFNDINPTNLWSAEFSNGFGLLPSFTVTQGLLGLVLWILLLTSIGNAGFKALKEKTNTRPNYFVTSSFFSVVFLWMVAVLYVPSHVVIMITFVLTGVFVASLVNSGQVDLKSIGTLQNPLIKKLVSIGMLVIVIVILAWIVVFTMKIMGLSYFHKGVRALSSTNTSDVSANVQIAENSFNRAIMFDKSDTYYQALSEVNIIKISGLTRELQSETSDDKNDEVILKQISDLVTQAVDYSRKAITIDGTNFYNYLAEARISEVALSLKVENAYDNAKNSYASALKYNPYDPSIYLSLARLEVTQNKLEDAQRNIGASLQLKPNYIDSIFLLSQIQVNQGQTKDAITSVQYAIKINPTNPLLHFQLGLLYYNDKNYSMAIDALTQALKLDEQYANAQYFLGLSYARLNKMAEAIDQFESLVTTNPDNQEVALILSNLRKGKSPFNDAPAPIDSKPEKRSTLPIKEKTPAKAVTN